MHPQYLPVTHFSVATTAMTSDVCDHGVDIRSYMRQQSATNPVFAVESLRELNLVVVADSAGIGCVTAFGLLASLRRKAHARGIHRFPDARL